ncbi:unnamed protein product [Brassicogethes aeneus]|uniref:MADF domain-containing protein n=1 Tax=Brassicogethes aeneus TaxID=1431903 RepID=A0A9P0BE98_BRAAE|nr:unnamed protein product [Brassicogethes aeneus]
MLQYSDAPIPVDEAEARESNDVVPKFVEAVQARPALWDHTLPLKNRGSDVREKLWMDVHIEINGSLPLNQLDKKKYTPSGSGRYEKGKKWKYFDLLFFLAEKNAPRPTHSNIIKETQVPLMSSSPSCSSWSSIDRTPSLKRKETSDKHEDLLQNLLVNCSVDLGKIACQGENAGRD